MWSTSSSLVMRLHASRCAESLPLRSSESNWRRERPARSALLVLGIERQCLLYAGAIVHEREIEIGRAVDVEEPVESVGELTIEIDENENEKVVGELFG